MEHLSISEALVDHHQIERRLDGGAGAITPDTARTPLIRGSSLAVKMLVPGPEEPVPVVVCKPARLHPFLAPKVHTSIGEDKKAGPPKEAGCK
jgi:hypothetical protein